MKRGFTLVEVIVVAGVITLLSALAIPNVVRNRITANECVACATLKTISTAFETYAAANGGSYPTAESDLTGVTPPYLNRAYQDNTIRGYTYTYQNLSVSAYCIQAEPASSTVGINTYSIRTGGILSNAACS